MKKIKIGTIRKHDIVFIVSKRFISIGCILNNSFKILYDIEQHKFINSCSYCTKHCKIKKIVNKYIKRKEPFNFENLIKKK